MSTPTPADEPRTGARLMGLGCVLNVLALAVLAALSVLFLGRIAQLGLRDGPRSSELAPADERAVRKVLDAQVRAWNKGDLEGFMAGYWKDENLAFVSGDTVTRGWDATHERYRKKYFTPDTQGKFADRGELSFEELEVDGLSASAALVRGRFVLKHAGGTATGRFTLTFRKFPDGWKITSDHTSAAEKPDKK